MIARIKPVSPPPRRLIPRARRTLEGLLPVEPPTSSTSLPAWKSWLWVGWMVVVAAVYGLKMISALAG